MPPKALENIEAVECERLRGNGERTSGFIDTASPSTNQPSKQARNERTNAPSLAQKLLSVPDLVPSFSRFKPIQVDPLYLYANPMNNVSGDMPWSFLGG